MKIAPIKITLTPISKIKVRKKWSIDPMQKVHTPKVKKDKYPNKYKDID